jgi:hypothetical protein
MAQEKAHMVSRAGNSARRHRREHAIRSLLSRIGTIVMMLSAGLALSGCGESWTWHQKLTVTVETPQGEVSGSSVQEVHWEDQKLVPGSPGGKALNWMRGEATVVDLGQGRYLFALVSGADTLAQYVVLDPAMLKAPMAERGNALEQTGLKAEVPRKYLPLLVTFDDINDPASVKRVDPDNLDAVFGCDPSSVSRAVPALPGPATARLERPAGSSAAEAGDFPSVAGQAVRSDAPARERADARTGVRKNDTCYSLKSITLEITSEPVTEGKVEQVLGSWLKMPRRSGGDVPALKLPNDSPRGWENLGALSFWSLDMLQDLKEKYQ